MSIGETVRPSVAKHVNRHHLTHITSPRSPEERISLRDAITYAKRADARGKLLAALVVLLAVLSGIGGAAWELRVRRIAWQTCVGWYSEARDRHDSLLVDLRDPYGSQGEGSATCLTLRLQGHR